MILLISGPVNMYRVDIEWYHGVFLVIHIIIGIFDISSGYSPGASKPSVIYKQ